MKLTLLKIIAGLPGIRLPFLRAQASIEMGSRPGDGELEAALRELKTAALITEGKDTLSSDRTFTATPDGELEAEMR